MAVVVADSEMSSSVFENSLDDLHDDLAKCYALFVQTGQLTPWLMC